MTIYPEVGEATGALVRPPLPDDGGGSWTHLPDEVRQERNRDRAARRARGRLRRYAVRNHLRVMWTLTYRCQACQVPDGCVCGEQRQPESRAAVKEDVNRFLSRLRSVVKREGLPYVYVIERGSRGTQRLHVHLLLPAGIDEDLVELAWGHGWVDVSLRSDGVGGREGARRAAAYAAKYLGKSLGDEDPAWAHSYERSQGFNVREVKARTLHEWEAWKLAAEALGGLVDLSRSLDWEDYYGPPAWSMCTVEAVPIGGRA